MAVVVSKADALVEMVKAHESQEIKKANKIGQILCNSIQKDSKKNMYNAYIDLDRETKQLFPIDMRKSEKKLKKVGCESSVEIVVGDNVYEIEVEGETIAIKEKNNSF